MQDKFTHKQIQQILVGYKAFIQDKKENTINQYLSVIEAYLRNEVLGQVEYGKYKSFFSPELLCDFQEKYRRGQIVRSSLKDLKDYFIQQGYIEKYWDYDYEEYKIQNHQDKKIISIDDIKNIVFSENTYFRNEHEKIATQCVAALNYFCLFEQRYISSLKCSDILIGENLIRNIRTEDKEDKKNIYITPICKWIYIPNECLNYIKEYIEHFDKNMETNELFFSTPDHLQYNNGFQNHLFANYKLKDNSKTIISAEGLIYSMMYHYLVSTRGMGISKLIQIVGMNNTQLIEAWKYYLSMYEHILDQEGTVKLEEYSHIYTTCKEIESQCEGEEDELENCISTDTVNSSEWKNSCIQYMEADDIDMNDILNFDPMSPDNHEEKDINLSRLVRSTSLSEKLKQAYNDTCQLCGTRLMKNKSESYSEAHHIQPYNRIHMGDDTISNMIVLCPNCHTQFDNLYYAINPENNHIYCVNELDIHNKQTLKFLPWHKLDIKYLTYTWKLFKENQKL